MFLDQFQYFFSLTWKFDGDSKSDIVLSSNDSLDHKSPSKHDDFGIFKLNFESFFDLEIWWGFQIRFCTFPKWLSGPKGSNFLVYGPIWIIFFLWLGNLMGIPNPIFWTSLLMLSFLFFYFYPLRWALILLGIILILFLTLWGIANLYSN